MGKLPIGPILVLTGCTFFLSTCSSSKPQVQTTDSVKEAQIVAVDGATWLARARRDLLQSRWHQAKRAFQEALKQGIPVEIDLAEVEIVLGELPAARERLEALLAGNPSPEVRGRVHSHLGLLAKMAGQDNKALEDLDTALSFRPNDANSLFHSADIHRRNGNMTKAIFAYSQVLKIDPNDADALRGLVLCHVYQKNYQAAAQAIVSRGSRFAQHHQTVALMVRLLAFDSKFGFRNPTLALRLAKMLDPSKEQGDFLAVKALASAANQDFSTAIDLIEKATTLAKNQKREDLVTIYAAERALYERGILPEVPLNTSDPRFLSASLDPDRESPYGKLPYSRRPGVAMADRLAHFAQGEVADRNSFENTIQANRLARLLESETVPPEDRLGTMLQWAKELLRAGETLEALNALKTIDPLLQTKNDDQKHLKIEALDFIKAIAFLRQAEQDNCLENHTSESCILPIREGGVHSVKTGANAAIEELTKILEFDPEHQSAKWLLNLAYMLLGDYPQGVPQSLRMTVQAPSLPPGLQPFTDIASELGLDTEGLAGGSVVEDFDNDGFLDILVSSWGTKDPLHLFRNAGDGTFVDVSQSSGLSGINGGLNMVQTDYDNDGLKDVLILRGAWMDWAGQQPNSLMRNKGNFQFEDVTEQAGLLSFHPTQAAVWLDFDNDGFLDLFIGNESGSEISHPCELFHNQGDGTFLEIAAEVGLDQPGFVKGVTAGDIDNDGWMDLYLSRYLDTNILYKNEASEGVYPRVFKNVTQSAAVSDPVSSFPTWFWDYDNDGLLDLFVADYNNLSVGIIAQDLVGLPHQCEPSKLYRNLGNGQFEDVSEISGLNRLFVAMGSNFGDFDNNGFLDLYLGTGSPDLGMLIPNRLFSNLGNGQFQDVTFGTGVGHLQKGHGVSFADLDQDGDLDLFTVMGGAYSGDFYRNALFENPGTSFPWIQLELIGTSANRAAIGARLILVVEAPAGETQLHRQVTSGGSFGASPLRQFIGLGDIQAIKELRIFWPGSQEHESFQNLRTNTAYRITQGHGEAQTVAYPKLSFTRSSAHSHH